MNSGYGYYLLNLIIFALLECRIAASERKERAEAFDKSFMKQKGLWRSTVVGPSIGGGPP